MNRGRALMALGVLMVVGGVLGAAVASFSARLAQDIGGMYDERLLPLAVVTVAATIASGVALFLKPKLGVFLATAALIPQVVSFAIGSVAYAFNLWPNYRVELGFPGGFGADSAWSFELDTPGWMLRTDANFTGAGIGIDLVATAIILAVVSAYWLHPRPGKRPN
ncbi:hypothetical protein K3217_20845 [bacterium BD-1]|nr:hypothetical protein [Ottowia caeni]